MKQKLLYVFLAVGLLGAYPVNASAAGEEDLQKTISDVCCKIGKLGACRIKADKYLDVVKDYVWKNSKNEQHAVSLISHLCRYTIDECGSAAQLAFQQNPKSKAGSCKETAKEVKDIIKTMK